MNTHARVDAAHAVRRTAASIAIRGLACALTAGSAIVAATAEAQAQAAPQPGAMFSRLDTNGDDVIDKAELDAARRAAFDRADTDGDDYVTAEELAALRDDSGGDRGRGTRGGRRDARRGDTPRDDTPRDDGPRQGGALARLDADGDGRVSAAEYLARSHAMLDRFDANDDERITREELDAARAQLRGARSRGWAL